MNFDFLNNVDIDLNEYDNILKAVADEAEIEAIEMFVETRTPIEAAKEARKAGFDKKSLNILYSIAMLELNKKKEAFALLMSAYSRERMRGAELDKRANKTSCTV